MPEKLVSLEETFICSKEKVAIIERRVSRVVLWHHTKRKSFRHNRWVEAEARFCKTSFKCLGFEEGCDLGDRVLFSREREREMHITPVGSEAGEVAERTIVGSVVVDADNCLKNDVGVYTDILAAMRYLRVFWCGPLVMLLPLQRPQRSIVVG